MSITFDVQQKEHTGSPLFHVKVIDEGVVVSQFEMCFARQVTLEDAVQQASLIYAEQIAANQKSKY